MSRIDPTVPSAPDALLSIVEIARHFSLPESTARYYCKRFAAFIPSCGEGRRRRFRQEVLPVISTVLEVMRTARNAHAVEQELEQRYPRNAEGLCAPTRALPCVGEFLAEDRGQAGPVPGLPDLGGLPNLGVSRNTAHQPDRADTRDPGNRGLAENAGQAAWGLACSPGSALQEQGGSGAEPQSLPAVAMQMLQQQTKALETIGAALQSLVQRQEDLEHLALQSETAAQENTLLRREVSQLRQQVYAAENLQQADLEQLRTWMGRLVRSRALGAPADK